MQALSPPADLGAALRALRQTQVKGDDRTSLGTKCLHAVIARLAAEGVSQRISNPSSISSSRRRVTGRSFATVVEEAPPATSTSPASPP